MLTLRQGIRRFAEANKAVLSDRDTSAAADDFFRCHDTAHVVFGSDASIVGEGTVKLWTVFGRHVATHMLSLFARVPKTIGRARRMRKPWPWSEHEAYLDTSLAEIRAEFGIDPLPT